MTSHPAFTVIIPAHNEEAVIGRCLETILRDAPEGHAMEIIVAANGCTDRTVEAARASAPRAVVLDLAVGSKTGAINAANRAALHFPRIIVDADVECGFQSLVALAQVLRQPGVMAAAPKIQIDLSNCNWAMKAYYRVWSRQPYAKAGKGGAGCYGLSAAALSSVGEFPPIIGDDLWIHSRFADHQRRYLTEDAEGRPVFSVVYPPRTAIEQIRIEARRVIGTAEVHRLHPSPHVTISAESGLLAAFRNGSNIRDLLVYFTIKISARLLAKWRLIRGRGRNWSRDVSSRVLAKTDA